MRNDLPPSTANRRSARLGDRKLVFTIKVRDNRL